MAVNDDSDMKIAGGSEEKTNEQQAVQAMAVRLEREKENGNIERAHKLGVQMAREILSAGTGANAFQQRLLMAFTAELSMEFLLPGSLVLETARTAFDKALQELDSEFYDALRENGAYSFYLWNIREEHGETQIGKTFASLCGEPDRGDLIHEGTAWFLSCLKRFEKLIRSFAFIREKEELQADRALAHS